jgi:acid phosphatase
MKYKLFIFFTLLIVSFHLISCSSSKPENLTVARNAVKEYYESGGYDKELDEVINEAKNKFEKIEVKDNSVVIFDVDETALNNYEASVKMGFGYVYEIVNEWELSAKAPAIPQVKSFYDYLIDRGFKIIFLTSRRNTEYDATYKNLIAQGYAKFDTLITRNENEYRVKSIDFKSAKRVWLTEKGYDIAGTVGDQWTDLEGPYHGIQVKIPDYLYRNEF